MVICNFFLQGRCRYGDKCWNEHPREGSRGGGGGHNNNYNRASGQQQQPRGGGGGGGFGNRVWVNPNQQKGSYVQSSSFSSRGSDNWGRGGGGGGGSDWGRGGGGGGGSDWGRGGGGGGGGSDWGRGGGGGGGGGSDWGRGEGGGGSDWGRGGGSRGGGSDWSRGGSEGDGSDWGRGGGRRRDNVKSSEFSFSTQNRFSGLDSPSTFDRGGRQGEPAAADEDDDKKLEIVQMDIKDWESSGQWTFSCYAKSKASLSGFTDFSPEELRLYYYNSKASGDLQAYMSGVCDLLSKWRIRIQELKVMNPATRAALLAELNNPAPQASSSGLGLPAPTGFGSSTSGFGSKGFGAPVPTQANTFGFPAPSGGFGSSVTFDSALAAPTQPPSGFGSSSAVPTVASASSFSFAAKTSDKPAVSSGFGSASGFSFSSPANTGEGLRSGFGAKTAAAPGSTSGFGQTSGGFGASAALAAAGSGVSDSLFSPESTLTSEELNQFKAKSFTLGQIPLKPPPANLLSV